MLYVLSRVGGWVGGWVRGRLTFFYQVLVYEALGIDLVHGDGVKVQLVRQGVHPDLEADLEERRWVGG